MSRPSLADGAPSLADLLEQLGGIDPRRVASRPPPGKATEKDLIRLNEHSNRLYELVDGVLVEKVMGFPAGVLAAEVGRLLGNFSVKHDLGVVAGADAAMRLMPGLVRLPDVSFIRWERFPVRGEIPDEPIADLAPDLAVEVLSKGNTPREMERKLKEYFLVGVQLVWFVDRKQRIVQVFTSPDESRTLTEAETLDGGDVLPGLSIPVRELFARMPRQARGRSARRGKPKPGGKRPRKGGDR
jgi:Uma2 family endonuclease